jgi:hypothetical protein
VGDNQLTQGEKWTEQTRASIGDFWPKSAGAIPSDYAKSETENYKLLEKKSNMQKFEIYEDFSKIDFSINDFPGWDYKIEDNIVTFTFKNTIERHIGNIISVLSIIFLLILFIV